MGLVFFFWVWGQEPVVHSGEWTTGSGENAGKGLETEGSSRASGPLCRVDH